MITEIIEKIKKLYRKGLFDIIGSGLLNKTFFFVGNIFAVRFLSKSEYGAFGYADSIMAFIITLNGLGITNGVLQFCCESDDETHKRKYEKYGLFWGLIISLAFSAFCILYSLFGYFSINASRTVFLVYSLYPTTYYLFTYYCVILRCYDKNKQYAKIRNINAFIYATCEIVGTYFINEIAIVIALYMATIVSSYLGYKYIESCHKGYENENKIEFDNLSLKLENSEKKEFLKYSIFTSFNQVVTNLVGFADVLLIGTIISNPKDVAVYKVATVIPLALMFIPDSILMFFYPYFAKYKDDKKWIMESTKKLLIYSSMLNVIIVLFLIIIAPYLITILWGKKYITSVFPLRILAINYFISATFRYNIIYIMNALRKVKTVLIVNIISGALDILLNYILISKYGSFGAAFATLFTMAFTTIILVPVFIKTIKKE